MKYFWNGLQFRISALFIVFFLLILSAIFGVLSTVGKPLLEKQAHEQVILAGRNIVSELGRRIALAESLATALANLGEQLLPDDALNKKLTEHVLNYEGTESFIAGGGLWPAPYQYDPKIERRSFFWGGTARGCCNITMITMTPKALAITMRSGMFRSGTWRRVRRSGPSRTWIPIPINRW